MFEAPSDIPTEPYLTNCDVLATDYSSIMLDGLAAYKPVVLFSKDDNYLKEHGMYFNYPSAYSSRFADSEESFVDELRHARWAMSDKIRRDFFCKKCDGKSTERVVEFIKKGLYYGTQI